MDLPRLCLSEANLDHITELGTRDAHREDAESRRWCVNARHTQAHRLIHKLQPLHPQMSSSLRNLSSVWDYLCLILSPAPTEMPEGAGGVRMTCSWLDTGRPLENPWKLTLIQTYLNLYHASTPQSWLVTFVSFQSHFNWLTNIAMMVL